MSPRTQATLAIYCPVSENNNPFSEDYYWQAYQDFILALQARGIIVYIILDDTSYMGDGMFSVACRLYEKTPLRDLVKVHNVSADMVFNRSDFVASDIPIINDPYVHDIGTDKSAMYMLFAKYQPQSVICNSHNDVEVACAQMDGNDIVIKKPISYGGHDVHIGAKETVLQQIPDEYPLIVQEFLDTSAGVAGITTGVHDMRLSMCGGEIVGCYIRKARPGELHSNVSRGGKMVFMDVADTPVEVAQAAKEIDAHFSAYPRYYSIDFVSTTKGWKMLEINALLALLPRTDGAEAEKTLERLADYFTTVCTAIHANNAVKILNRQTTPVSV